MIAQEESVSITSIKIESDDNELSGNFNDEIGSKLFGHYEENSLVKWLKQSKKCLYALKEQCMKYREELSTMVFSFNLQIDLMDLIQFDGDLGSLALCHPEDFILCLRKVIYAVINTSEWHSRLKSISQIMISPTFENFPAVERNSISEKYDVSRISRYIEGKRLIKMSGIVTGVAVGIQYTKSTTYQCPQEDCLSHGDKVFKVCLPGRSESDITRCQELCGVCGSQLEESLADRILGEKCLVQIVPCQGVGQLQRNVHKDFSIANCVNVILKDTVESCIDIGKKYEIIGTFIKHVRDVNEQPCSLSVTFEAFAVKKLSQGVPKYLPQIKMPNSIEKLYQDRRTSAWSFASSLAYCFAASVCPGGVFHTLKLALLLSLVSSKYVSEEEDTKIFDAVNDDRNLHLLVVADDILIPHRLLTYSLGFDKDGYAHQPPSGILNKVSKDAVLQETFLIEGGSLSLAGDGICHLPNISTMKKETLKALQKVLEMRKLRIDASRRFLGNNNLSPLMMPLSCTVWATAEMRPRSDPEAAAQFTLSEDLSHVPKALVDQFSLVLVARSSGDFSSLHEHMIVKHIIQSSKRIHTKSSFCPISDDDFAKFLELVKYRQVLPDIKALNLLRSFFVASRRVRQSGKYGSEMPPNAFQTMINLATSHAKLSLRNKLTAEDAVTAIILYEESMSMRYGSSVLGINPCLHFQSDSLSYYLGPENDERMRQLEKQINYFCSSYCPGFDKDRPFTVEE